MPHERQTKGFTEPNQVQSGAHRLTAVYDHRVPDYEGGGVTSCAQSDRRAQCDGLGDNAGCEYATLGESEIGFHDPRRTLSTAPWDRNR
jgi:hypothetical protein